MKGSLGNKNGSSSIPWCRLEKTLKV